MKKDWMTPKEYFERIVKPTGEDYWADRSDHRKENAVFQLSSFSERYFKYHKEKGRAARVFEATGAAAFGKAISKRCPEYGLLWDAANGVKHHFPDERTRLSAMETTSTGVWETKEYEIGGRWVTIEQAIDIVYEFWRKRIDAEGE